MHTAYVSVRLGLLALLDDADMYGYQLKSSFEARTGGVWPLNIGQVYTTLGRLERDGLVASSERPDGGSTDTEAAPDERQHRYSITADGRRALADWFADTPTDAPPPRDELIAKVLLAAAGGTGRALDVVTAQRTAVFESLQSRRRLLRAAVGAAAVHDDDEDPDDALARALVLDALVVRAEAELRWLDQCEARLLARRNGGTPTRRST